jgi:hypothetical protein
VRDGDVTWSHRYSFGSGSAPWIGGGALRRDGQFVPSASGMPVIRAYFVPRAWSSWQLGRHGLAGTGS